MNKITNQNMTSEQHSSMVDVNMIRKHVDAVVAGESIQTQHRIHYQRRHHRGLTLDYATALRHCAENIAEDGNTVILEDDALAHPSFFADLVEALGVLGELRGRRWSTLKLFSTEAYFGWELLPKDVLQLTVLSALGGLLTAWLLSFSPCGFLHLNMLCAASFCLAFCLILGKQNIIPPFSEGIFAFEPATVDAHTLAVAFPFTANEPLAKALVDAAQSSEYVPVDLLLSDLAEKLQQNGRFYMIPSIFQNIGIWSTNSRNYEWPRRRRPSHAQVDL
eukprot:g2739.t1